MQRAFIAVSRYAKIIKIYQDFCRVIITNLLPLFMNHSVYLYLSLSLDRLASFNITLYTLYHACVQPKRYLKSLMHYAERSDPRRHANQCTESMTDCKTLQKQ